ncbi:flagellar motor switch phosphatase FliY [Lachnospiraceae bacterium MD1]|uniref:Flagellar motor switch phosphatase FliY n=1 Tax=Variimorphobacter saccharofermentans TaxID=2755051 RepID=A0A839JZC0_9FIRM|nr:flagellar motor switch phosphatase FliY [Variimorphobacter saccharofermentans]MBB2182750.1 flagellar motor switch phosphatase FliY [Variimorphobacter saccharofermentans]
MDGMLSQEEINALLGGMGSEDTSTSNSGTASEQLTNAEKDAIGEISNISMGTAATTLFSLVNQRVVITTPVVEYATWKDIVNSYDRPCVFIQIYYEDGLDGNNILILKEKDVKIITDLMMGGDGTNIDGDLTELHLSAISEAMNQMMGSAATSISSMLEKRVNISPPKASIVDLYENVSGENIADFLKGDFVRVSFHMEIGDLVDSVLMQLYPFDFARDLYQQFIQATTAEPDIPTRPPLETNARKPQTPPPAPAPAQPAPQPAPMPQQQPGYNPYANMGYPNAMPGAMPYMMQPMQDVNVQPVQFTPFAPTMNGVVQPENIDLLMDVPLEVTVELGRTSKSIKEILDFSPGTIIELNRLAGEPIDVLVNGKFVAKGEVVVMEEAFGIRVTEITKQKQLN